MAEPVTKKIDALPAMTDAVATNDKLMLLDVSAPAATMTKLITMNQVRISSAAQLDANVVENAKIKDGAVSTPKLDQTAGSQAVATGTIRDNAVTFSKMQDVDGYSVVGRSGSTAGDADEITAGENTVLGRVGSGNVAFNKLATTQLANTNARTVIGNATNASATPSAIASNTDGYVLRQNGDTLGFGTLTDKSLATGAVTAGKIAAGGISASTQFATGVVDTNALKDLNVTGAKIANATITDAKLASIDKTLLVRLLANDEVTALRTWTNEFLWPPSLNGLVIKEAYATLSVASSSGSVVVAVKNTGNTVTTLTISQGALYSPAGTINTSYRAVSQFNGCSFQVTSAGTGAKGLSIILVVGRA